MKPLMIPFAMLLLVSVLSAQSISSNKDIAILEVIYTVDIQMNKNASMPPGTENVEELMESVESMLLCGRTKSLFFTPHTFDKKIVAEAVASILLQADKRYFTDMVSRERVMEEPTDGDILLIEIDIPINWNISEETTEINGLKCVYAEGIIKTPGFSDEKVSAWFTTAYPLSFGPCYLSGLPGLILKATIGGNKTYSAKSIKNITDKGKVITPFPKGKRIKSSEFYTNLRK
ncbi:MAG: GLPGLI family protein [Bacteroidia bacterium]